MRSTETALLEHQTTTRALTPGDAVQVLGHPDDVVNHPGLTTAEKREVLAVWASDAHSVVDAPRLRQLDGGAVVGVDEVLEALRALDAPGAGHAETGPTPHAGGRPARPKLLVALSREDEDDDPPPSPAAALSLDLAAARRRRWEPSELADPPAA